MGSKSLSEMPSGINNIMNKYELLKKAWEEKKLQEVEKLLLELKIEFAATQPANERELLVMREVFEIGAQYSVCAKDVPSFERYMSMLKSVYTDQSKSLPESSRKYELLGLNLLCLLSQNRLSDFHTELELLPCEILLENPYIANPVQLEQFIMEGKYNKVIDTRYNVPADSYKFFIDVLLVTIRDEIASCMEKAYEDIDAEECRKMCILMLANWRNMLVTKNGAMRKMLRKYPFFHRRRNPRTKWKYLAKNWLQWQLLMPKRWKKLFSLIDQHYGIFFKYIINT